MSPLGSSLDSYKDFRSKMNPILSYKRLERAPGAPLPRLIKCLLYQLYIILADGTV